MFAPWFKKASLVVAVAVAGLILTSSPARAGSVSLGTSGWLATWDSSLDGRLGVNYQFESTDAVFIEKFAVFTTDDVNPLAPEFVDPLDIVFQRVSVDAKPFIVINQEAIVNQTGLPWAGFRFTILPSTGDVRFDEVATAVSPPGGGFSIDPPFTTHAYNANQTILEVGGGVLPSTAPDNVWFPGQASGGLVINTNATQNILSSFKLEELPITGVIPLPAAAWTGLTALAGLGLLASRKSLLAIVA